MDLLAISSVARRIIHFCASACTEIEQSIQKNAKSGTRDRAELEMEDVAIEDDSVFDIAASLDALDELEEATRSSRPPSSIKAAEEVDVDQVFAKFKEGVRAQVADSDSSTHYDLGVAYKEMGLLPDAINEFEESPQETRRIECMCSAMTGMISFSSREISRKRPRRTCAALARRRKRSIKRVSLYYDLGIVYGMKGSSSEALYYFKKIAP